jgi:hypothetical protein
MRPAHPWRQQGSAGRARALIALALFEGPRRLRAVAAADFTLEALSDPAKTRVIRVLRPATTSVPQSPFTATRCPGKTASGRDRAGPSRQRLHPRPRERAQGRVVGGQAVGCEAHRSFKGPLLGPRLAPVLQDRPSASWPQDRRVRGAGRQSPSRPRPFHWPRPMPSDLKEPVAVLRVNDRSTLELDLRRSHRANQSWRMRTLVRPDERPRQVRGRRAASGSRALALPTLCIGVDG